MKILKSTLFIVLILLFFAACNNKKLTEVVEVPLPKAEEKMTIGDPDDIHAEEGSFELQELGYRYDELAPNLDHRRVRPFDVPESPRAVAQKVALS